MKTIDMSDKNAPRVFVTQYTKQLNFAEANQYGEVVFLTQDEYRPEPVIPRVNDSITQQIMSRLQDYIPGHDFILTTGSALPNVVAGAFLAGRPGAHKFLKWSRVREVYEVFTLRI